MDIPQSVRDLTPLAGEVIPIRTVQETRPPEDFADAYVAEVNLKAASKVVKALDSAFPKDPSLTLSHLRRFVKRERLPAPVRAAIEDGQSPTTAQTIFVLIASPLPDVDKLQTLLAPFAPIPAATSPPAPSSTTDTPPETPAIGTPPPPQIPLHTIKVPLQPPFNPHQAETWTETLWPVIFNPAAPRSTVAPPPQILKSARESIQPRAGYYLSLARKVAQEAEQSGLGRGVGAVIVDPAIEASIDADSREDGEDRSDQWVQAVIAVAGDARYSRPEGGQPSQAELHRGKIPNPASKSYNADLEGGPELHALMRAIDLVAHRRRQEEHRAQSAGGGAELRPLESFFLYHLDSSTTPAPLSESPSSPKKRKHEEPNPESSCAATAVPDLKTAISPSPSQSETPPPLPAPPPSTIAIPDPILHSTDAQCSSSTLPSANPTTTNSRVRAPSQGGYLCTDLDVYLSHEPCICCSMGMLLSRFRAVIFPRKGRMASGGLASEPVVAPTPVDEGQEQSTEERMYYGLHWRKELNWRALGFEFVEEEEEGAGDASEEKTDIVFHA
ncbi:hypothetical protein N7474_001401 [Penicillium riverlandense]|uniref:uncharacterized protein n=1 Tax=Penicillium riverlandense TaxID=1903569 RepID=UPI0025478BFD|nr:uncharacterized protein N7474_001401 [Penicillium riverlandense]KAJ5833090.1 hypothetical protein N7474_001401 [Penicillium riverlandense]